ncbi:hypothetical protein HK103_006073 [Boothiomyces macroporosus]|uniref:Uncharacterized protein n=1 Tax=Boothiomyces macroporosus TaxID=261099 RepID=A0AAD5UHD2_9FUNG|nr:hypothetical protein HK103_006073 [Boothiomyces macroporosus]
MSKVSKLPITKPMQNAILMWLVLVLADWISIGLYIYNIVYYPPNTLYLINTCSTNIHASFMIILFIHIKDLLFHGRQKTIYGPKLDETAVKLNVPT